MIFFSNHFHSNRLFWTVKECLFIPSAARKGSQRKKKKNKKINIVDTKHAEEMAFEDYGVTTESRCDQEMFIVFLHQSVSFFLLHLTCGEMSDVDDARDVMLP